MESNRFGGLGCRWERPELKNFCEVNSQLFTWITQIRNTSGCLLIPQWKKCVFSFGRVRGTHLHLWICRYIHNMDSICYNVASNISPVCLTTPLSLFSLLQIIRLPDDARAQKCSNLIHWYDIHVYLDFKGCQICRWISLNIIRSAAFISQTSSVQLRSDSTAPFLFIEIFTK